MTTRRVRTADDAGFTAAELLFAAMLGLMVMTVAYIMFETALKSFQQIEVQTTASRSAAHAANMMAKPIREMQPSTISSDYAVRFLADNNDDGDPEWNRFYIEPGTTRLIRETQGAAFGSTVDTPVVVADNVYNQVEGVPLFTYFREPGGEPLPPAERRANTKVIRLVVLTRGPGKPLPPLYRLETDVYLRNKK